jgi:hypothetical protein
MDVKELSGLRGAEIRGIKVRFSPKPTARFSRRDMARDDQSVTRAAETSHVKLRMARPTGFEPVTSAFGGQRKIHRDFLKTNNLGPLLIGPRELIEAPFFHRPRSVLNRVNHGPWTCVRFLAAFVHACEFPRKCATRN